ncbi:MAG: hypothetical protein EPN22_16890 [Nitrospirae bacterium]|nr:MAG: hypothetical protein EPN22_16890 [Nitrospirota bacterium]
MSEQPEEYYCPVHKYNPPANSGFLLCPFCEKEAVIKRDQTNALVEHPLNPLHDMGLLDG